MVKETSAQQLSFRCVRSTCNENPVERNRANFWTPLFIIYYGDFDWINCFFAAVSVAVFVSGIEFLTLF